jgi:methyl coenzyme M reductase subunit D
MTDTPQENDNCKCLYCGKIIKHYEEHICYMLDNKAELVDETMGKLVIEQEDNKADEIDEILDRLFVNGQSCGNGICSENCEICNDHKKYTKQAREELARVIGDMLIELKASSRTVIQIAEKVRGRK